jgi:hypothetical protein
MTKPSTAVTAMAVDLVAEMDRLERLVPAHLLPHVSKSEQVAVVVQTTVDALAQDRYRRKGIPYVKIGGRVRYLRDDVLAYLAANRVGGNAA